MNRQRRNNFPGVRDILDLRTFLRGILVMAAMLRVCEPGASGQECPSPIGRITAVSTTGGSMQVSGMAPFPLPAGAVAKIDGGVVDPYEMKQGLTIPPGGFDIPAFCNPALYFTTKVVATGCGTGTGLGKGTGWAAGAPCPDPEVQKFGDTSTLECGTGSCDSHGAGADKLGDVDTIRGGSFPGDIDPCAVTTPGVHVQVDVPVRVTTWLDAQSRCPDEDGVYDPGVDTLISSSDFILTVTTDRASAQFAEKDFDGCFYVGAGPAAPVTVTGSPAPGPGCVVGQSLTLAAAGLMFTGDFPLYDIRYSMAIPFSITSCDEAATPDTCTITTDPCRD